MTFELPSGLPEGPWEPYRDDALWSVVTRRGYLIAEGINDESTADAIASIPAMAEEIGKLRERIAELYRAQKNQILSARFFEPDYVSLRAFNAELLTAAKQYLSRLETLCDCTESSGCKDAARRAAINELIAKAEAAP